jgi:hypothetical protein
VGRLECPYYQESYAIGGISYWLNHLWKSRQGVEARGKVTPDPTGWGLRVRLTLSP